MPYDLQDIEDMLEYYGDKPLIPRKQKSSANGGERELAMSEPGEMRSVDAEAALAGIAYGNIHDTWKTCMASMLGRGEPVQTVIETLFAATTASPGCQADPAKNKWMYGLCELAVWFLQQDPLHVLQLPPEVQVAWHQKIKVEGKKPLLVYDKGRGLHLRGMQERREEQYTRAEPSTPSDTVTPPTAAPKQRTTVIVAKPFERFDPAKLPPREWLY